MVVMVVGVRPLLMEAARHAPPLAMAAAPQLEDDVAAIALVAGTAIGGGFLALPATTAPAGCVPSALVLVASSAVLLAEAFIVADLVIEMSQREGRPVSLSTCARNTLGQAGGVVVEVLFTLLMCSTLLAQFAKGGSLVSDWIGLPYQTCCALVALTLSCFSLGAPRGVVNRTNSRLAIGFVLSLVAMFVSGAPLADWTALSRANWSAAYASAPTLLQLLVYNEIIPTVCNMLNFDRGRVRRALCCGAAILFVILSSWSALGIGLAATLADRVIAGVAPNVGADPLAALLATRTPVGSAASALAVCAVSTTVIATNLALQTLFIDIADRSGRLAGQGSDKLSSPSSDIHSKIASALPKVAGWSLFRVCALPLAIVTTLTFASVSPNAFFLAIDFAGAYPLALLWGVSPPLMALAAAKKSGVRLSPERVLMLVCLGVAAIVFVCSNMFVDVSSLVASNLASGVRWRLA